MKKYFVNKVNILLGLCLILLQFYDTYMTLTVINLGCTEGNLIVQYFIESFGVFKGLIFVKSLAICMIIMLVICSEKRSYIKKWLVFLLVIYTVTLGHVTAVNYDIIF